MELHKSHFIWKWVTYTPCAIPTTWVKLQIYPLSTLNQNHLNHLKTQKYHQRKWPWSQALHPLYSSPSFLFPFSSLHLLKLVQTTLLHPKGSLLLAKIFHISMPISTGPISNPPNKPGSRFEPNTPQTDGLRGQSIQTDEPWLDLRPCWLFATVMAGCRHIQHWSMDTTHQCSRKSFSSVFLSSRQSMQTMRSPFLRLWVHLLTDPWWIKCGKLEAWIRMVSLKCMQWRWKILNPQGSLIFQEVCKNGIGTIKDL